jgi:hypothetical protein
MWQAMQLLLCMSFFKASLSACAGGVISIVPTHRHAPIRQIDGLSEWENRNGYMVKIQSSGLVHDSGQ